MGIFCGRELCELLKVGFSQLKLSRFVGNDGLWVWLLTTPTTIMLGQETTNEIELGEQEMLIEATMSTWQVRKLLLDKYCLASEREATFMIPVCHHCQE